MLDRTVLKKVASSFLKSFYFQGVQTAFMIFKVLFISRIFFILCFHTLIQSFKEITH